MTARLTVVVGNVTVLVCVASIVAVGNAVVVGVNVVSLDKLLSIADVADTLVDKLVAAFLDVVVLDWMNVVEAVMVAAAVASDPKTEIDAVVDDFTIVVDELADDWVVELVGESVIAEYATLVFGDVVIGDSADVSLHLLIQLLHNKYPGMCFYLIWRSELLVR